MTEILIHGVPGSPYLRTVLMTLEEKGISWRLQSLHPGGNHAPGYRAIHPFHKIPTIDHGDFRLYETSAIINYIDRLAEKPSLHPADFRQMARMDQMVSIVNAYVTPRVSAAVTFPLFIAEKVGLPFDAELARTAIQKGQEVLDEVAKLLGDHEFFAGSSVSLADLMLAPHLSFLPDFSEGRTMLNEHGNLYKWIDRIKSRPSFAATEWALLLQRFPVPMA